ncbi:MAG: hypothetical protein ABEI96_06490 [Haloarculaceae archaeon]
MNRRARTAVAAAVAALVVLAGCSSGIAGQGASTTTNPPSTTGPDGTTIDETPTATGPGCAEWVSFYGLGGPGETTWAADRVAIGYTLTANASVFFVAETNGTVLGTTHAGTQGLNYGVTADGDAIALDRNLTGRHRIRVVAYADADGNGEFDAETDTPCRTDGDVVATQQTINFSALRTSPDDWGSNDSTTDAS